MAYPAHSDLTKAQRRLRQDDRRLRLRFSYESPTVLIERQTFRGRIGRTLNGEAYTQDAGRRREEGHVVIATVPIELFDAESVRMELRAGDTWRQWDRSAGDRAMELERRESLALANRRASRFSDIQEHAADVWNRYAWTSKSRVSVGQSIN